MNYLVVGDGSREHAILQCLKRDPHVIWTGRISASASYEEVAEEAKTHKATVIIGPDNLLAEGLADRLREKSIRVFGPSQEAAQIEWSKSFTKRLMLDNGIPTAPAQIFSDIALALECAGKCELPIMIKADGLALGKGARKASTHEQAREIVLDLMEERIHGEAGDTILFEEMLVGPEVSVFAFCNGRDMALPLVSACDYKQAYDGNQGPNTGGMGSYSPAEFWDDELAAVSQGIIQKVLDMLAEMGTPFQGMLYLGLMITEDGPQVIEFNARFGDPEAQVILPRLKTPFSKVIEATIDGKLTDFQLQWSQDVCVGVVVASQGYPDHPKINLLISGLENLDSDVLVFLGGVQQEGERLKTTGGRILTLVAFAATYSEARTRIYENIDRVLVEGAWYRQDIAAL